MGEPENYDRKEFIYRIGTFFLLVGVGLLIFFMLSEAAESPQLNYFCWSMILLILGFLFRAQYKKPKVISGRFTGFKNLFRRGGGGGKSGGGRSKKAAKKEEAEEEDDDWEYE